jgi:hypothetical protein
MNIQITTVSSDAKYLNASIEDGISTSEYNGIILLKKYTYSGRTKLEDQETIVSISQDPEIIGVIYSS